jgi:3-oxoadipate enol-lactonase
MFVDLSDLIMHVRLDGRPDAPPLVLLHSLGTDLRVWDPQADELSRVYRVVRPDLRGHGLTEVVPGPYSSHEMALDILALLDALGIQRAHVAGLSIGGMIAQALASQAPHRVASLILCDTAMTIPPPELWSDRAATVRSRGMAAIADAVVARWVTPEFAGAPEARGLRAMLLRTAPEGYAGAAEAIAAADLTATTKALDVPALVLVGDRDEATPLASAEALREAISGARLETIANAAHIATVEQQPALVTGAMLRFLASQLDLDLKCTARCHTTSASGGNHD